MPVGKEDYILRLQTSLVLFISYGTAKMKLAILAFLYCGEFVKTSIAFLKKKTYCKVPRNAGKNL